MIREDLVKHLKKEFVNKLYITNAEYNAYKIAEYPTGTYELYVDEKYFGSIYVSRGVGTQFVYIVDGFVCVISANDYDTYKNKTLVEIKAIDDLKLATKGNVIGDASIVYTGAYVGQESAFTTDMKVGDIINESTGGIWLIKEITFTSNTLTKVVLEGFEDNANPTVYTYESNAWSDNSPLEEKANVDGNYQTMTVGSADNLTPYSEGSGANDTTPFVFQSTGGSSDVGNKAYLKALRGNSVVFNQLIKNGNMANSQNWSSTSTGRTVTISNGEMLMETLVQGYAQYNEQTGNDQFLYANHKYLVKFTAKATQGSDAPSGSYLQASIKLYSPSNGATIFNQSYQNLTNSYQDFATIVQPSATTAGNVNSGGFRIYYQTNTGLTYVGDKVWTKNIQVFDLDEDTPYDTVLKFNRLFPKPYYADNAGQLLSCKTNGIKNVGYNAFDGELEQGGYYNNTGLPLAQNSRIRNKNVVRVIPGETYTLSVDNFNDFTKSLIYEYDASDNYLGYQEKSGTDAFVVTLKNNTHHIHFVLYNSDHDISVPTNPQVCVHLTWDGSRTGYEPYESKTYTLPNVELRSAGSVYDELKPDGTLIRRVGVVDLGTLTWEQLTTGSRTYFRASLSGVKTATNTNTKGNLICSLYQIGTYEEAIQESSTKDKVIGVSTSTNIAIYDSSKVSLTAEQFKTAMSGLYLFYELATPTEEQDDDYKYQEIQDVDDFGTQEFLYDNNITIPVPQGNEFFYPVDYKAFMDSLGGREDVEYDASELVSKTQLANYLKTITGYDETKTQTLKNVNGTFTWVDDE